MKIQHKDFSNSKLHKIGEILGIFEESHREKDWLLEQLKKRKISVKNMTNSFEILKECPDEFVSNMLDSLSGLDIQGFEDIKTLTKTYHWFFTDIVSASNPSIMTKSQVKKIIVLNEIIRRTGTFSRADHSSMVVLPTGDGMAIGFSDSPEKPVLLTIEIHKALVRYNKTQHGNNILLIRVGIDMGPVYVVKDLNNMNNVWGPGIILTRRVMDLAGDMNIFASGKIADELTKLSSDYKKIMHSIGSYHIKHGEEIPIFNIYGPGFGNKVAPRLKKVKKLSVDESLRPKNNFKFESVEIILEILDTNSMLTHHSWIWKLKNISKEPKDLIFYTIDGDTQKQLSDMNVKISDSRGKELEITSVNANKPYHKEFFVKINPILPKKTKSIKLEYDWEEPERNFVYRVPTDCNEMTFTIKHPKNFDSQIRILKVDLETGLKTYATPNPITREDDDSTIVTWTKKKLQAFDSYQIVW